MNIINYSIMLLFDIIHDADIMASYAVLGLLLPDNNRNDELVILYVECHIVKKAIIHEATCC